MKQKKQLISMLSLLALACCCLIGTSYAYFTDSEAFEGNVIQVGTIDIELFESQFSREEVVTDTDLIESGKHYQDFLAVEGEDVVPGQMVPKCPYLHNIGSNPSYVRFRIWVLQSVNKHLNFNWNPNLVGDGKEFQVAETTELHVDNKVYTQYIIMRNNPLPSQAISGNPLVSVGLKPETTKEDVEWLKLNGYLDGVDSKFTITIAGDAIQTYGFDTAKQAFEMFEDLPADKKHD